MKTAAAIRHVHFEDAGIFTDVLTEHGYALRYFDAGLDDLRSPSLNNADLLIVLGAPIGAYEEDKYPFLKDELILIEQRLGTDRPALGICLGAQLFARALGSRIYPGPAKEIGWAPITLTEAGKKSAARHLESGPVLHWHGDTFDLPAGANRLASTAICRNQAYVHGRNALAFQFHPEAAAQGFERWLIGHACEIGGVADISVNSLRADTKKFSAAAEQRGRGCFSEWLDAIDRTD